MRRRDYRKKKRSGEVIMGGRTLKTSGPRSKRNWRSVGTKHIKEKRRYRRFLNEKRIIKFDRTRGLFLPPGGRGREKR